MVCPIFAFSSVIPWCSCTGSLISSVSPSFLSLSLSISLSSSRSFVKNLVPFFARDRDPDQDHYQWREGRACPKVVLFSVSGRDHALRYRYTLKNEDPVCADKIKTGSRTKFGMTGWGSSWSCHLGNCLSIINWRYQDGEIFFFSTPQTLHSIPCSFRHARFSIPAGFSKTSNPVILNLFQNLGLKSCCTLRSKNPLNAGKSRPSIGSKTGSRNKFGMTVCGTSWRHYLDNWLSIITWRYQDGEFFSFRHPIPCNRYPALRVILNSFQHPGRLSKNIKSSHSELVSESRSWELLYAKEQGPAKRCERKEGLTILLTSLLRLKEDQRESLRYWAGVLQFTFTICALSRQSLSPVMSKAFCAAANEMKLLSGKSVL